MPFWPAGLRCRTIETARIHRAARPLGGRVVAHRETALAALFPSDGDSSLPPCAAGVTGIGSLPPTTRVIMATSQSSLSLIGRLRAVSRPLRRPSGLPANWCSTWTRLPIPSFFPRARRAGMPPQLCRNRMREGASRHASACSRKMRNSVPIAPAPAPTTHASRTSSSRL